MENGIKIDKGLIDQNVSNMKNIINNNILNEAVTKGNEIINLLQNSEGEFVEAIKDEIGMEIETITSRGFLLNTFFDFVAAAADDFIRVDEGYNH